MTCIYKWKYLNCNSKWIYENAWNSLKNQEKMSIFMNGNGMKKWFINISDDEKWLIFMIENSLKMDDKKSFINMIGFWKWLMKISENGKPIINTSEIFFWDYDMKNHDIHENKNVCPEIDGEKMHEQKMACKRPKNRVFSGAFWRIFQQRKGDRNAFLTEGIQAVVKIGFIVVG